MAKQTKIVAPLAANKIKPGAKVRIALRFDSKDRPVLSRPMKVEKPERDELRPSSAWHLVGDQWSHKNTIFAA